MFNAILYHLKNLSIGYDFFQKYINPIAKSNSRNSLIFFIKIFTRVILNKKKYYDYKRIQIQIFNFLFEQQIYKRILYLYIYIFFHISLYIVQ